MICFGGTPSLLRNFNCIQLAILKNLEKGIVVTLVSVRQKWQLSISVINLSPALRESEMGPGFRVILASIETLCSLTLQLLLIVGALTCCLICYSWVWANAKIHFQEMNKSVCRKFTCRRELLGSDLFLTVKCGLLFVALYFPQTLLEGIRRYYNCSPKVFMS